ncbi:acyl CoA binding protein-domain-containing protein [Radiomyces spectabilis]|uniref:acyl CoA binding protein-domain-containing protein n=1 Tax=Radiomyces spectabilis TaxID=64574 RepID=UPI00221E7E64|nr:acyl CoA binding protein-domain-containing protein [Radiomyces spectabilis]KAI8376446.1 acyl CoA binding protein-domain-containing protein [Radiomyces spectabilis]
MHSLQDTQHQFCQALAIVRTLPDDGPLQPSATEKLRFYGLYKQATQGDCTLSPPPATNKIQYAKWKAWQTMKSLNPVQAQKLYVNLLAKLLLEFIEDHPEHDQYVEFLQYLQLDDLLPGN